MYWYAARHHRVSLSDSHCQKALPLVVRKPPPLVWLLKDMPDDKYLRMPQVEELVREITALFRDRLEVDVPGPGTDLLEAGLMDSLIFVDLVVSLEQEFAVTITFEKLEIENFRSVISIAKFVADLK